MVEVVPVVGGDVAAVVAAATIVDGAAADAGTVVETTALPALHPAAMSITKGAETRNLRTDTRTCPLRP